MTRVIIERPEKGLPRSERLPAMEALLKMLPEKYMVTRYDNKVDWSAERDGWHIYLGNRADNDNFVVEIALDEQYKRLKVRGAANAEELKEFFEKFGEIMGIEEIKVSVR